jgi:hypothetical protein
VIKFIIYYLIRGVPVCCNENIYIIVKYSYAVSFFRSYKIRLSILDVLA